MGVGGQDVVGAVISLLNKLHVAGDDQFPAVQHPAQTSDAQHHTAASARIPGLLRTSRAHRLPSHSKHFHAAARALGLILEKSLVLDEQFIYIFTNALRV